MNSKYYAIFLLITLGFFQTKASLGAQTFEQQFFQTSQIPFPLPDLYPINPIQLEIAPLEKITRATARKPWTFMVYIAADNDLRAFAANNIKQMASVGSNKNINIVIHLDIRLNGNKKMTRRYYVEKNKITPIDPHAQNQEMDSGDPQTLISFCESAIRSYPAQNYALILWNHGTGIIDPRHYKIINPTDLFMFNPQTNKLELDRSVGYLDLLSYKDLDMRGVCMDGTTGNYLTNQKMEFALHEICTRFLGRKKLNILGFDACLMSMIEVADITKEYADIMVGSQEVELGTGWNYARVLQPFDSKNINSTTFAQHIVGAYQDSYHQITNDFTQSAIALSRIDQIEQNIDSVSRILVECLAHQKNNSITNTIKQCRNRKNCTSFDEPSYVDIQHFYINLIENLNKFQLTDQNKQSLIADLQHLLIQGKKLITSSVLQNVAGKNINMAHGLSIYFPETRIHESYMKTNFAKKTAWLSFLSHYLR
jgi:hypothetical protein